MALKLHELGPRLKLKLVKIEEGVCRGNVVYHSYVNKSKGEIKAQMDELKRKRELKSERKRVQDTNVKRKQDEKDAKETAKGEKKKKITFEESDVEEKVKDEDDDLLEKPTKRAKVAPKKKGSKAKEEEEVSDFDMNESKDVRAFPKAVPQQGRKAAVPSGKFVGKKRPRTGQWLE